MKKKRTPPAPARPAPPPEPSPEERIEWLLGFLQRDLGALRTGERIDLREDMNRLLAYRDAAVDLASVTPPDSYSFALAKQRGEVPNLPWSDVLVLEVQAKLKAGVALLEAGRTWEPFDKPLTPMFTPGADKTVARSYRGRYEDIMLASAVDLLVQWWPQLRRCAYEACHVLFLPDEGRQIYHDKKCSANARWHRLPPRDHLKEKERRILRNGPGRGRKKR